MGSIRFLHVADVHLDASIGLKYLEGENHFEIQNATFLALDNLVELCRKHFPDFVIFSGDMYNNLEASLRARFALKKTFEELCRLNIPVYYAHGNHDPLNEKTETDALSFTWPSNVHVFPTCWKHFSFPPTDECEINEEDEDEKTNEKAKNIPQEKVRIYGISHETHLEHRNLAHLFHPEPCSCLKIGVLHTSLNASVTNNSTEIYAPCSLADLQSKNMHYWALGHVHSHDIVQENPPMVYPGSLQGLHINETGAHGCVLVEVETYDSNTDKDMHISQPKVTFIPLAPVKWQVLEINLSDKSNENLDDIVKLQHHISQNISQQIRLSEQEDLCTDHIFRITLHGNSVLSSKLKDKDVLRELAKALQKSNTKPRLWVKDIQSMVRPLFNFEEAQNRDDILGESLRIAKDLRNAKIDRQPFFEEASDVLGAKIARYTENLKIRNSASPLNDEQAFLDLLSKAEEICVEIFEPKQN